MRLQTQHKIELDKRDGKFGDPSPMTIPPLQQMSRFDQPYGPTIGYPPAYGAPYGQPQPPHHQGYPPPSASAYPPPGPYPPQQQPGFWR